MARRRRGKGGRAPKRLIAIAVGVAALAFAVQGGEYSTTDIVRQRRERARLLAQLDSAQREVDSLARVKHAILTDPAVQERIAREEFGMVRDKEILYRFAEPDSGNKR